MTNRILVTLDGTTKSEIALDLVAEIAHPGDEVTLLRVGNVLAPAVRRRGGTTVVQPGAPAPFVAGVAMAVQADRPVFAETTDQAIARARSEIADYLADEATKLEKRDLHLKTEALLEKDAAPAIIRFARKYRPDFIVMGTKARSPAGELVFGSVASEVLRSNVAPVLLVALQE
jgi:nucleotide-binding universal stress UspA family protein